MKGMEMSLELNSLDYFVVDGDQWMKDLAFDYWLLFVVSRQHLD